MWSRPVRLLCALRELAARVAENTKEIKHMADNVLQPLVDAVTALQASVAADTTAVAAGVAEIQKLAAEIAANSESPAVVADLAAKITAAAGSVDAGSKSINDAVAAVETPPTPAPSV